MLNTTPHHVVLSPLVMRAPNPDLFCVSKVTGVVMRRD